MTGRRTAKATASILERILDEKAAEVARRRARVSPGDMARRAEAAAARAAGRGLRSRLAAGRHVGVVAEVKRRSPSKGPLAPAVDAASLAAAYEEGGAAAVSVLTDGPFFGGDEDDLRRARQAVSVPVLRKDFLIDAYQVDEAKVWGADAVLLIAAALADDRLRQLLRRARALRMDALVEVHTEEEMERAAAAGARLIGINNRDLRTFATTLDVSLRLADLAPPQAVLVSESGVHRREDVVALAAAGVDGVLVGEAFVRSSNPEAAVRGLAGVPRRDGRGEAGTGDGAG